MDVTNRFVLDFAKRFAPGKLLDYGCGGGEMAGPGTAPAGPQSEVRRWLSATSYFRSRI